MTSVPNKGTPLVEVKQGTVTVPWLNYLIGGSSDVATLQSQVTTLQSQVTTLQSQVTDLQTVHILSVNRSSNQTVVAATPTKIQFDTKVADPDGWYDNVTNFRYTPLKAGYYLITVGVACPGATTDGAQAYIYLNGSLAFDGTYYTANSSSHTWSTCTAIQHMNGSTDYLEGWGYSPTTTINSFGSENGTFMTIHYIK